MKTLTATLGGMLVFSACAPDYELHGDKLEYTAPLSNWDDWEAPPEARINDLDVFVVLDGSGSMADDLDNVGRSVVQLKNDIDGRADAWSITFITADPARTGAVGPLTAEDADIDLLMAPAMLPITGGEKGFASVYHFLHQHPNWIHDDRDLLIFQISDEDEQSNISADLFTEWLDALKPDEWRADAISIVSTTEQCSPDIGHKFLELAQLLENQVVDLCTGDWQDELAELSRLTAYSLKHPAEH